MSDDPNAQWFWWLNKPRQLAWKHCPGETRNYTGWWFQPLWKILISWGYYSQYMEKHIPNHQPVYESQCKASLDLQCSTAPDHSSEVVVNVTCICTKLKTWVTLAIPGILNITTEDVNLNCQVNAPRPYWWLSGHGHCNPSLEYQPYHKSNYPLSSQACLF